MVDVDDEALDRGPHGPVAVAGVEDHQDGVFGQFVDGFVVLVLAGEEAQEARRLDDPPDLLAQLPQRPCQPQGAAHGVAVGVLVGDDHDGGVGGAQHVGHQPHLLPVMGFGLVVDGLHDLPAYNAST